MNFIEYGERGYEHPGTEPPGPAPAGAPVGDATEYEHVEDGILRNMRKLSNGEVDNVQFALCNGRV
jgi:hypothetical protein